MSNKNARVRRRGDPTAPNKASGDALRQQILEGFYGHSVDLAKLDDAAAKKPAIRVTRLAHAQA
jgi:hypothetical protein